MTTPTLPTGLSKSIAVLFLLFLIFSGLYFAKEFLVPLTIAAMLAMLLLPLTRWLEKKGLNRALSIVICLASVLLILGGLFTLIFWQITELGEDLGKIEEHVGKIIGNVKTFISDSFGISEQKQTEMLKEQQKTAAAGGSQVLSGLASSIFGIMVDFVLVVVYIFLFLFLRDHLKKFILKVVPAGSKEDAKGIMSDSSKVIQKYLGGLGSMIFCLWVMYTIGYSALGIENALFFAVLCGLLEIVPFVGNLTGTSLTILMAISQGGGTGMILGVLGVYAVIQFVQTYILEPMVVGSTLR